MTNSTFGDSPHGFVRPAIAGDLDMARTQAVSIEVGWLGLRCEHPYTLDRSAWSHWLPAFRAVEGLDTTAYGSRKSLKRSVEYCLTTLGYSWKKRWR